MASIDYRDVLQNQVVAYPIQLANLAGGVWYTNRANITFSPDIAIIREIAYTALIAAGGVPDPNIYCVSTDLGGGTVVGSFGNLSGSASAAVNTVGGSISNPMSVISTGGRLVNTVAFQVMTPSATVADRFSAVGALTGQLIITIEYIRYK